MIGRPSNDPVSNNASSGCSLTSFPTVKKCHYEISSYVYPQLRSLMKESCLILFGEGLGEIAKARSEVAPALN